MRQRKSIAVLGLMAWLMLAPSVALAAAACAAACCPAVEEQGSTGAEDCRAALAQRECCANAPASRPRPLASLAPISLELPSFPVPTAPLASIAGDARERGPSPRAHADLLLRTSPLRLSVVLLI